MREVFKEYNSIAVRYRGEDITKEIIHQIINYRFLSNGAEVIYYDTETGEIIESSNFEYIKASTILYKIDKEVMTEYLEEIPQGEAEYIRAHYLTEYSPSDQIDD